MQERPEQLLREIVNSPQSIEDNIKRTIEKYRRFAQKYGPLWQGCSPPEIEQLNEGQLIDERHSSIRKSRIQKRKNRSQHILFGIPTRGRTFRVLVPLSSLRKFRGKLRKKIAKLTPPAWYRKGGWYGYEDVFTWHRTVQTIRAVFDIATLLKEGVTNKKALRFAWKNLRVADVVWDYDLETQRHYLAAIINSQLASKVRLRITWEQSLQVSLDTGLGFIGVLWLQLAQMVTGKIGLYVCDGCGALYVRTGRKPQEGRKNFCDICREGDKASKRLYAQEKRKTEANP
jgi:hypothetical protein